MAARITHTFVAMEISEAAFDEIKGKLNEAGYEHVFIQTSDGDMIDMHGLALMRQRSDTIASTPVNVALGRAGQTSPARPPEKIFH